MDPATVSLIPLFDTVPKAMRETVPSWADEIDVQRGEVLIRQGDYGREFFVIVNGLAKVFRDGEPVATLGPGEFFGEMAMLDGPARTATVAAITDMRLLVVGQRSRT